MQKIFIGILLIILVVVLFALQNAQPVDIDFWLFEVHSNLSLVIFLSVTFGALSSFLMSLPYRARKNKALKERDKKIKILEDEMLRLNPERSKPEEEDNNNL
jgi:putative membrane protein